LTTSFELFLTTALLALVSALGSALLGYPLGNWLAGLRRLRSLLSSLLLVPFLLPSFLVGLVVLPFQAATLGTAEAFAWVVCAHLLMNIGFIARVVAASSVPKEQLEAAQLDGAGRWQSRLLVEIPQQLPGIASASLLVALYSATSYGLVLTLGRGQLSTLETEIAELTLRELDLAGAGLVAILQTCITVIFFVIARRIGANPSTLFGETATKGSRLGAVIATLYLSAIVLLVGNVVLKVFTLNGGLVENLQNLATRGSREILNISALEAAGNSLRNLVVCLLIALPVTWFTSGRKKSSLLVLIPIGVSPVVVGLMFLVAAGYLPGGLGNWWLVPIAQSVFLIPLGYQILRPARQALEPEMLEAAQIDGASKLQSFASVEAPVLARPIAAAVSFMSLAALGEFGAASFLAYGSQATLPLAMFRLAGRPGEENLGMALTAALLLILLAFVVTYFISREPRSNLELNHPLTQSRR
jgi:thiamine transport system permease protein